MGHERHLPSVTGYELLTSAGLALPLTGRVVAMNYRARFLNKSLVSELDLSLLTFPDPASGPVWKIGFSFSAVGDLKLSAGDDGGFCPEFSVELVGIASPRQWLC